jgi:hypothetical protein
LPVKLLFNRSRKVKLTKRQHKAISSLGPMDCKWPIEEPDGTTKFCGAKRLSIGLKVMPYCEKHYLAAYVKTTYERKTRQR